MYLKKNSLTDKIISLDVGEEEKKTVGGKVNFFASHLQDQGPSKGCSRCAGKKTSF